MMKKIIFPVILNLLLLLNLQAQISQHPTTPDQLREDCPEMLTDTELGNFIFPGLYEATNTITSSGTVFFTIDTFSMSEPDPTDFVAGESISLKAGFQVQAGALFTAKIETPSCLNGALIHASEARTAEVESLLSASTERITLLAQPNPFQYETQLRFQLPKAQQISLQLLDQTGRLLQTIVPWQRREAGEHIFSLQNGQGLQGLYFVFLQTESEQLVFQL
ncbi:MAG: 3-coathanger stack domain-containing protein, partial [Bacteroidota bacterium]